MKIAIASSDGMNISEHFGQSICFIVFETEEGNIVKKEIRQNKFTPHALGQCGSETNQRDHDHQQHHHHNHKGVVAALKDCDTVICRGMGLRASADLLKAGIDPYIIEKPLTPEEAINAFLAGNLQPAKRYCKCHEKGSHQKSG